MTVKIDMEMPKNCEYCRFCTGSLWYNDTTYIRCFLTTQFALQKGMRKNPGCPLKEVEERAEGAIEEA